MKARPIWLNADPPAPPFVYARHHFYLNGTAESARLRCASAGEYLLFVNGALRARGLGNTRGPNSVWQPAEIAEQLVVGENELLFLLSSSNNPDQNSWFMAEGIVVTEARKRLEIGSGRRWMMQPAAAWLIADRLQNTRVYDAPRDMEPLGTTPVDATAWSSAMEVEVGGVPREWHPHALETRELVAASLHSCGEVGADGPLEFATPPEPFQACKFVQRQGLLSTGGARTRVATDEAGRAVLLVLDFGRILRGYPRLRLTAEEGNVIDLGWAQTPGDVGQVISYRCAAGYRDWCSPSLGVGRYLVLRVRHCSVALSLNCVSVMERVGPSLPEGRFSSSGISANTWRVGAASLSRCRQEVYDFASNRAGVDWSAVYACALNDFYQSGDTRTTRATLECSAPPNDALQLAWHVLVAQIYWWYSADSTTTRLLVAMLEKPLAEQCEHLLAAAQSGTTVPSPALCFTMSAAASKAMASMFRGIGAPDEGAPWSIQTASLTSFLDRYWSADEGLYQTTVEDAGCRRLLNELMLCFDLTDDRKKIAMLGGLRPLEAPRPKSLLEHFFQVAGLWKAGAVQMAMHSLARAWTAIEHRDGQTWAEKKNCPDQGACPGVDYFLGSRVLGIAPGGPGYEILWVRPDAADLESAAGQVNTVRGSVEVEWRLQLEDKRFELDLCLAASGETRVCLPRCEVRFPRVILNGETVWQNEKVRANAHVRELISEPNSLTLVLARAGRFRIVLE